MNGRTTQQKLPTEVVPRPGSGSERVDLQRTTKEGQIADVFRTTQICPGWRYSDDLMGTSGFVHHQNQDHYAILPPQAPPGCDSISLRSFPTG